MLPYLFKRFTSAGGKFKQTRIDSIEKLADEGDYDVVINCSGLGAKKLVNDDKVKPVRGQVIRVEAPWIYQVLLDDSDDGNYVIPKYVLNISQQSLFFIRPNLKHALSRFGWNSSGQRLQQSTCRC